MKYLLLFLFLLPAAAQADTYFVSMTKFDLENGEELQKTMEVLIRTEILKQGQDVTENSNRADWTLRPRLLKINDKYILSLTKLKRENNAFSDRLKMNSLLDLDTQTQRLVEAAIKEIPVDKTKRLSNLSSEDRSANRRKLERGNKYYAGFGPGFGRRLSKSRSGVSFVGGRLWSLDDSFSLRVNVDALFVNQGGGFLISGAVGTQYLFFDRVHSPYAFAAMGFAGARSEDDNHDTGWTVQSGLGYMFFRSSPISLGTELSYTQGLFNLDGTHPNALAARVVVYW